MKHYKTEEVPATTRQRLEKTTCDMCGEEIKEVRFEVDEVELRHRTGSSYPECGSGEETSVDMCGACFEGKLKPWLESQGVKLTTTEWDW